MRLRALNFLFVLIPALRLIAQAPPSGDTFVSSATPKINYGPSITLVVGQGTTAYVQFNLSGIPASTSITKASLRLYVDGVAKNGSFDVYQLNNTWSENALTYSTPPPPLGASATGGHPISIIGASFNQFLVIDITSLVQGWVNRTITNNGVALALTSGSAGAFSFDSKESLLTANGPELEIAYAGGAGPQGPPGSQGIQGPPGPQGLQGIQGIQGFPGIDGAQGRGGQGFSFKGAFDPTAAYVAYDVVSFSGSSYVAKAATNPGDPAPDTSQIWSLMAQQGAVGAAGTTGPQGLQGIQGLQGFTGPQGPAGVAPPNVALTTATNNFAASQTINGNLTLAGLGNGLLFPDGTSQTTAAGAASGVPSGFMILSASPTPPAGYTINGQIVSGHNAWSVTAPLLLAREDHGAAILNGKVYAIGGQNLGVPMASVEVFNPAARSWNLATSMSSARRDFGTAVANGNIYAIGGRINASTAGELTTVEVFDGITWTPGPQLPTASARLAAAALNNTIYAMGGNDPTGQIPFSTLLMYDPTTSATWTTLAPMPTARFNLAAAAVNGQLFALGGTGSPGAGNAIEAYDPSTDAWTTKAPMPTARASFSAVVLNGKIYAIGGGTSTVDVYDPATDTWGTIAPTLTSRTAAAATVDASGVIYHIGGISSTVLNSVEQYGPAAPLYTFVKN
jgi:N-acetylneuraminic acid mutarotase